MPARPRSPPVLHEPEQLLEPPAWDAIFSGSGPLELEIGAGHGGFALGYCAAHAEARLVAMEWRRVYAQEIVRKAEACGLGNLLVLQADAKLVVPRIFAPGSLAAVHIHFPDPWWKRRHFKRRLVDSAFAHVLRRALVPGGLLELRTDVEHRAREMMVLLEAAGFSNEAGAESFSARPVDEVASSREVRYVQSGQPVFRIRLRA